MPSELKTYIEGRIKRQRELMPGSTENTKNWREIIIGELQEILARLEKP